MFYIFRVPEVLTSTIINQALPVEVKQIKEREPKASSRINTSIDELSKGISKARIRTVKTSISPVIRYCKNFIVH